mmetsp:Transcript_20224/g.51503  ORF Transcript_20224/g.51503 Transcript_20224/m.51503 type:complete len:218 (+) Transcript_20224:335-988(+)
MPRRCRSHAHATRPDTGQAARCQGHSSHTQNRRGCARARAVHDHYDHPALAARARFRLFADEEVLPRSHPLTLHLAAPGRLRHLHPHRHRSAGQRAGARTIQAELRQTWPHAAASSCRTCPGGTHCRLRLRWCSDPCVLLKCSHLLGCIDSCDGDARGCDGRRRGDGVIERPHGSHCGAWRGAGSTQSRRQGEAATECGPPQGASLGQRRRYGRGRL